MRCWQCRVVMYSSLMALTVAGCGSSNAPVPRGEVERSDSAGVLLLTLLGDVRGFTSPRLDLQKEYEVGEESGTELYRVHAASFLPSGELVIANAGVPEVLVVDDGEVLTRFGRRGEGPGEFVIISSIHTPSSGRIVTYDHAQGRLTEFDRFGSVLSTRKMAESSRVADLQPLTLSSEGTVLAIYTDSRFFRRGEVYRDTTPLFRFEEGNPVPDTLARWGMQVWSFGSSRMGATRAQVPYSPTLLYSGSPDRIALADSHQPAVAVYDADRGLTAFLRWETVLTPVSDRDVARWNEERFGDLPENMPDDVVRNLTAVKPYQTHPVNRGIHVSDRGDIWIAPAVLEGRNRQTWIIFDREGEPQGSVRLTNSAEVLASTGDRIAVLTKDDLDVEIVTVYRIAR